MPGWVKKLLEICRSSKIYKYWHRISIKRKTKYSWQYLSEIIGGCVSEAGVAEAGTAALEREVENNNNTNQNFHDIRNCSETHRFHSRRSSCKDLVSILQLQPSSRFSLSEIICYFKFNYFQICFLVHFMATLATGPPPREIMPTSHDCPADESEERLLIRAHLGHYW